jgi:hypothetical protein
VALNVTSVVGIEVDEMGVKCESREAEEKGAVRREGV